MLDEPLIRWALIHPAIIGLPIALPVATLIQIVNPKFSGPAGTSGGLGLFLLLSWAIGIAIELGGEAAWTVGFEPTSNSFGMSRFTS